ncbi:polysialyltransferase family glycosyltransferase [Catenovulum agarivorans]|uniref:polysialyltransferase family glycosyltransferase n=1 Tax=Catenovulum agarivorans TaxID=1172192 RepID=UPI002351E39D|nr:polysialyltransferase family glycosyltransferase [Catenovulum agarivorans]
MFSSPLHFLVANLVNQLTDEEVIGIYILYQEDKTDSFHRISKCFEKKLSYVVSLNDIRTQLDLNNLELVFSNRFDKHQISIYRTLKKLGKVRVSFMEEGMSIYLKKVHFLRGSVLSESLDVAKKLVKIALGRDERVIAMKRFIRGYTFNVAEIPGLSSTCEIIDLKSAFLSKCRCDLKYPEKSIVILSQWFVAKRILTIEEMVEYYKVVSKSFLDKDATVYFKPHPWDPPELTESVIKECGFVRSLDDYLPIEIHLLNNPQIQLYGFWTSALFYTSAMLSNNVYSLFGHLSTHFDLPELTYQYELVKDIVSASGVKELS